MAFREMTPSQGSQAYKALGANQVYQELDGAFIIAFSIFSLCLSSESCIIFFLSDYFKIPGGEIHVLSFL